MSGLSELDGELTAHCTDLYDRTRDLWRGLEGKYPTWECRFSILYGPPIFRPELFIVGSNPGFDPKDLYDKEIETWPTLNEYTSKDWLLARKLRKVFGDAGLGNLLERSVGANRLFFKSKSLERHSSGLGWKDNPAKIRGELEEYCSRELGELIRRLEPKLVLTLGLSVFDALADTVHHEMRNSRGRRLAGVGRVGSAKMLGIIHPTGAQVSTEDWNAVAVALGEELGGRTKRTSSADIRVPPQSVAKRVVQRKSARGSRQPAFLTDTVIKVGRKPPGSFGYQPIHDFWRELAHLGEITIEQFHNHMLSIGWRRPQGGALTYEVTRTDAACMCREGFAIRVRG